MIADKIDIIPFTEIRQPEIDMLMLSISQEFSEPISIPKPNTIANATILPDLYLLAISSNEVVGTIGISKLKDGNSALKRMFLHNNFRGNGIAKLLLEKATNWAVDNNVKTIYLGTMTQFIAAQKFYEKNDFEKISINKLPEDFPINPIDALFYQKRLI